MADIKYEIKAECGILSKSNKDWTKEINIIAWNDGKPKADIRDWSPNHEKMGKGITLTLEECTALASALNMVIEKMKGE